MLCFIALPLADTVQNKVLAEELDRAKYELDSIKSVLDMKNSEQKELRGVIAKLESETESNRRVCTLFTVVCITFERLGHGRSTATPPTE